MAIARGTLVEVTVEKPAAGGRMIARVDGQVTLVSGAIPGERVSARVERVQRDVVYAECHTVIAPSPDRRQPAGDPACGGMTYSHIALARQRALKAEVVVDGFARLARLQLEAPPPVEASPEHGYRMRARVHVRGGRLGSFREGTHEVCDVGQTRQLLAESVDVLGRLAETLARFSVAEVGAIELMENIDASQRVLHIQTEAGMPLPSASLAALASIAGVSGLSVSEGPGRRARVVAGTPWVSDSVEAFARSSPAETSPHGDAYVRRHAGSFFQANRYLTADLARAVAGRLSDGPVVDLYAGVGLFALVAAARGSREVVAVEEDPTSAGDLIENARAFAGAIRVESRSVESLLGEPGRLPRDATLVVDPPRTGMSRAAIAGVIGHHAPRIVYVSCDVATLSRDARRLIDAGYRLSDLVLFDLFPNTPHIESLAVFDR